MTSKFAWFWATCSHCGKRYQFEYEPDAGIPWGPQYCGAACWARAEDERDRRCGLASCMSADD